MGFILVYFWKDGRHGKSQFWRPSQQEQSCRQFIENNYVLIFEHCGYFWPINLVCINDEFLCSYDEYIAVSQMLWTESEKFIKSHIVKHQKITKDLVCNNQLTKSGQGPKLDPDTNM